MTEPTDVGPSTADQLFRLIRSFGYTTHGQTAEIVDAIVAKWGTPPAVAGDMPAWQQGFLTTMNQDPYPALGGWFVQFWEGADVAARVYGNDAETLRRRCATITTPQPTQAQAGAVPLTDGQVESLLYKYGYDPDDEHMVAMLKEAHGIQGGQHGTERGWDAARSQAKEGA